MSWTSFIPLALDVAGTAFGMPGLGRIAHGISAGSAVKGLWDKGQQPGRLGLSDYLDAALGVGMNVPGMMPSSTKQVMNLPKTGIGLTDKPIYGMQRRWTEPELTGLWPLIEALSPRRY